MTKWFWTFGVLAAATVATAMAQQPGPREGREGPPPGGAEGRQPGGPGGRQPGGPGGPGFRPLPNPVVAALDADQDGVISAEEIKNASAALAKLDKNNDGKLTDEETRPNRFGLGPNGPGGPGGEGRGPGGPGGAEGRGPNRFEGRRPGGQEGRGPGGEGRGPGGPGGEGRGPGGPGGPEGGVTERPSLPNHEAFLQHALEFDADKDGKLSKEELTKFAEDMSRRRGQGGPGGEGRGPVGRGPGGRGPGGEGGERPQRPE